jgi:hypothetical protein
MRYADNHCEVNEEYEPEHVYVFSGVCRVTKKPQEVRVPAAELYAYRQGARIQDAMVSLNKDEREFLMSGTSAEGWDRVFGIEEE